MSYKAEVQADSTGAWSSNSLRFTTEAEAKIYAADLEWRWTSVRQWRVTECNEPTTHRWTAAGIERLAD
jgi:hypothetical protein